MKRAHASFALYTSFAVAFGFACSPDPLTAPPPVGTGGTTGTGATGGSSGTGNVGNVAGSSVVGGSTGVGGSVGKGGTGAGGAGASAGGAASSGGAAGTAGTAGTLAGGTAGTGTAGTGTAGTGTAGTGTAGTGTAGTSAGAAGSAGAPAVACDAAWTVGADGFVKAPVATGCWHGYAFAGADATSTAMPTTFETCGAGCVLSFSGSVAMSATFSSTAYIGFNIGQAANGTSGTVVPAGTGLTVNFTNAGGSPLRVQMQGATGDTVATDRWCADLVGAAGPVTIPYTSFNTECWAPVTTGAYAKQPIKAIQLVIPGSDMAAVPFDVTLTSVTE